MASVRSTYADQIIEGAVAAGQASLENPLLTGGNDGSGNRQPFKTDSSGVLQVAINSGTAVTQDTNLKQVGGVATAVGNGVSGTGVQRVTLASDSTGVVVSTLDTAALITAAAVTTGQTGADQTNSYGMGIKVVLDMTTVGTGSVTLTIEGKDAASGKYYTLLAGAAVVTISTNVYTIFPGATAATNVSANDILPRTWRVKTTANNANATTYTVGASVIG